MVENAPSHLYLQFPPPPDEKTSHSNPRYCVQNLLDTQFPFWYFYPPKSDFLSDYQISDIRNIVGAGNVLGFMALGIVFTLGASILADLTDEHERVHHVRQEGLYYGAMSLFQKFSSGFGSLFAGLIADFSGISNLKGAEMATPENLSRFGWTLAPVLILVTVIAVSFLRHYDIDKARLKEILAELASRKTADAEVVSGMNFGNETDKSGKR